MPSLCAVDEPDSSGKLFGQLTETIAADIIDDHTIDCGQVSYLFNAESNVSAFGGSVLTVESFLSL